MSGFEVAGVVLGAFPIAISALERYREVATRLGLFFQIRLEYKKAFDNLKIHQLTFTRHLRQLLLPLIVDDDKIAILLADPGGPSWKEQAVAELLERRLQDSFPLYMSCIMGLQQVMEDINRELAVDSQAVQDMIKVPRPSTSTAGLKSILNKDGRLFQRYRLKFSNGATVRERLFNELRNHNDTLEKLLDSSDKDAQLVQARLAATRAAAIDVAICKFWIQARKVWKALSTVWKCQCPQHEARLLLQHRTTKRFEVQIMFTKLSPSSQWEICKTRIAEGDDMMRSNIQQSLSLVDNIPIRQAKQGVRAPFKSALKGKSSTTTTSITLPKPLPTMNITFANFETSITQPINNLCTALEQPGGSCCGYLPDEDRRYYVYTINRQQAKAAPSISLAEILKGEVQPQPSRTQRYTISLILASSFLQLLESPWLPTSFNRTDVSFPSDPDNPNIFLLDQPHITRHLPLPIPPTATATPLDPIEQQQPPPPPPPFTDALDNLGIILLELCFGKGTLDQQPHRQRWPPGQNEREKAVFDVMAARDWQCHVGEEAGFDHAEAVGWCLGGNRSAVSSLPERWRQDMLTKVIEPLRRCRDYLTG
ncbi:hypothetical protein GE09DRAFT_1087838 [Coniochaeta sp. 2T2.1]|nr:hypothetical protein GE09DRAFT_1087838 [Coniochaeta sp. 2T2.1]